MVIKKVNTPSEMRRVVLPFKEPERISEQPNAQPSCFLLVPIGQTGTLVRRAELTQERTEPDRTLTIVTEAENQATIF